MGFPCQVNIARPHLRRVELRSSSSTGRPLSTWGAVAICFGVSLMLGVLIASSVLQPGAAAVAFALLVASIGYFTTVPSALAVAALAFLFEDGFLYGTHGVLTWHGSDDVVRLGGLLILAITVSLMGRWLSGPHPSHTSQGDE